MVEPIARSLEINVTKTVVRHVTANL